MKRERFQVSAGAALLAAGIYYIGDPSVIAAVLLPVLVHELGHLIVLRLLGLRVCGFRMELKGFCIDYRGYTGAAGHALAAAAGPAAGLVYAWAASTAGSRLNHDWLCLSAGASLILSVFNLLPALPLDGGRILAQLSCAVLGQPRGTRLTERCGFAVGALLLAGGIWMMLAGRGAALCLAATWLLLYQEGGQGIVKSGEIL